MDDTDLDVEHVVLLLRLIVGRSRRICRERRTEQPYLSDKPLSGLFPGPMVDGGRRLWDWNPNCRDSARTRHYSGFEGIELRARLELS